MTSKKTTKKAEARSAWASMKLTEEEANWIVTERARQSLMQGSPHLQSVVIKLERAMKDLADLGRICNPQSARWQQILDILK